MTRFNNCFRNKKVIITGHTGFKGSWLTLWMNLLDAKVTGISKDVLSRPSHYEAINLKKSINEKFFDLSDTKKTINLFQKVKPDFVFHLAAQALVKKSYSAPLETWKSNLIGTQSVLEGLRKLNKKCTAVIITSDKVYKNIETERGYVENDILGGYDPYSASKGATELLINSYVKSYLSKKSKIHLSIARAGNVIGGGDWSEGRLIPDCIKGWSKNKKVLIRSPKSTRPWQHVLEVIGGYITLAVHLNKNKKLHGEAFNSGPKINSRYTVLEILKIIKKRWPNAKWKIKKSTFKESKLLKLNSKKANKLLKWESILNFKQTIELVLDWYKNFYYKKENIRKFSINQIRYYYKILIKKNK